MTSFELLICGLLIAASAFLSGSEIALFSLSRFQLRLLKDRARGAHRKIKKLLGDSGGLLVTILVANEIINITLSTLVARTLARKSWNELRIGPVAIPEWAVETVLGLLITTPIILLLCEISPKVVAARANYLIAPLVISPLEKIYQAFKPVRMLLKRFIRLLAGDRLPETPVEGENTNSALLLKESDFLMMVEEGHKEGAIQGSELGLIRNVFEFDDTAVAEIATPLPQSHVFTEQTTLKSALGMIRSIPQPRVPVLSANRKQVLGVVYAKDLLQAKLQPELLNLTVTAVMRRPLFVNPTVRLNTLFRRMKQQRMHIAVVQEGTGDSLGIVTMSDILDTLFEDVLPEGSEDEGLEDTSDSIPALALAESTSGDSGKKGGSR